MAGLVFVVLTFLLFPRPGTAFLGRGTLLENEGDIFNLYCADFDRGVRVWHHREITREAVRRAVVSYFKVRLGGLTARGIWQGRFSFLRCFSLGCAMDGLAK